MIYNKEDRIFATSVKSIMMRTVVLSLCILTFFAGCNNSRQIRQSNVSLEELHDQAKTHYNIKDLDSMSIVADKIISLTGNDSLSVDWGQAMIYKGTVFDLQGQYDSAAYYFYGALRSAEEIGDKQLLTKALNNLGILYFNLRQTEEAISYYKRYLTIARDDLKDSVQVCKALNNIGNAYATIDGDLDKAVPYFEDCVRIAEKIDNEEAYTSAKLMLIQIQIEKGEYNEALQNIQEIRNRGVNHYYVDYTEAGAYFALKKYDKAIELYENILQMKLNSQELVLVVYKELDKTYRAKGDLQAALDYKDKYQAHRDSMHKVETHNTIEVLKIEYETDKKEMTITSLEKEKVLVLWLGVAGVTVLLLLLLILLFRQRIIRQKKEFAEKRISELEKEKQLVAAESLLDGENHERGRLSKELHDGLGGLLTMAKLNLVRLKEIPDTKQVDNIITLMDTSITEMRRMAHNLMPESLVNFGLRPVLEEFCSNSGKIKFHCFGTERRLSEKEEVNLYRIASELINNALKHSGASEINVQLLFSEASLSLTVQDNGVGFKTDDMRKGLITVKSRTELLGAEIHIYSNPEGKGTEITIEHKTNTYETIM